MTGCRYWGHPPNFLAISWWWRSAATEGTPPHSSAPWIYAGAVDEDAPPSWKFSSEMKRIRKNDTARLRSPPRGQDPLVFGYDDPEAAFNWDTQTGAKTLQAERAHDEEDKSFCEGLRAIMAREMRVSFETRFLLRNSASIGKANTDTVIAKLMTPRVSQEFSNN